METKKIIITGGANRIGRSIALELANYDTQIVIHYSKSFSAAKKLKIELENLGSIVHLVKADLNNFKQTQRIISFAHKKMKGINCLVNNASIFENDNLFNFSDKSFIKHINVNLKAPAILIRKFTPSQMLFKSTFFFKRIDFHCFLKCFFDWRLFFSVGPGETALTLIFGASFIAAVLVKVARLDLLKV